MIDFSLANSLGYNTDMNDRLVKIGKAARILEINPQTLRRWEEMGDIKPTKGTCLYSLQNSLSANDLQYPTIAYCKVSSSDQKENIERQHAVLKSFCPVWNLLLTRQARQGPWLQVNRVVFLITPLNTIKDMRTLRRWKKV